MESLKPEGDVPVAPPVAHPCLTLYCIQPKRCCSARAICRELLARAQRVYQWAMVDSHHHLSLIENINTVSAMPGASKVRCSITAANYQCGAQSVGIEAVTPATGSIRFFHLLSTNGSADVQYHQFIT